MKPTKRLVPKFGLLTTLVCLTLTIVVWGYGIYALYSFASTNPYAVRGLVQFGRLVMPWVYYLDLLVALACMVIGGVILLPLFRTLWAMWVFQHGATTTTATVLELRDEIHKDNYGDITHTYKVVFQFDTLATQVTLQAEVRMDLFAGLSTGARVMVRYAEANPRIALLQGEFVL